VALTPGRPRTRTITGSFLGFKTTERVTITNAGPAAVTVPAGNYRATLLVQTVTDGSGGRDVIKTWVVNGIGQVKTETVVVGRLFVKLRLKLRRMGRMSGKPDSPRRTGTRSSC
jgi:hypothetical protein